MKRFLSILLVILTVCMLSVGCEKPKKVINLTFKGNGGTLEDGTTEITLQVTVGEDFATPSFEKVGYAQDGYDKDISTLTVDSTLYAQWVKTTKVDFYETYPFKEGEEYRFEGGVEVKYEKTNAPQVFKYGKPVGMLPEPNWIDSDILTFRYWYYFDANGDEVKVTRDSIWSIEEDEFELYAKWKSPYSPEV